MATGKPGSERGGSHQIGTRWSDDNKHYGDTRYGYWSKNKFYYYKDNHTYSTGHRNGYHTFNYDNNRSYYTSDRKRYHRNRRGHYNNKNYRESSSEEHRNRKDENLNELRDRAMRSRNKNKTNNDDDYSQLQDRLDDIMENDEPSRKVRRRNGDKTVHEKDYTTETMRYDVYTLYYSVI